MPKYRYRCEACKREYLRFKRIENIDEPEWCVHLYVPAHPEQNVAFPMQRLFTANFQIIACREADKPENQLYKILTKGSGATDELALMREDAKRNEEELSSWKELPKPMTAEDILNTGIIEASKTPEGLHNWREKNINDEWDLPVAQEKDTASV